MNSELDNPHPYLLCFTFVHCLHTINLHQLLRSICLQAGLLNMTLLILKLSSHLFMLGLDNPFAILMGRRLDLDLLQQRAISTLLQAPVLPALGRSMVFNSTLRVLGVNEFLGSSYLLGSPAWQTSAFLTQEAGCLSHSEKYCSSHLKSCL